MKVSPKKFLGQHFLKNDEIAFKIVDAISKNPDIITLEIGPGTGVLTKSLINRPLFYAIEIDRESIQYLKETFLTLQENLLESDFLKLDFKHVFKEQPLQIIGNFPYHISTQIVFKIIENKHQVTEMVGMFQKEVALRITADSGNKTYGILSVLTQVFYDATYLFSVGPNEFIPPPKVNSGVIRLVRKKTTSEINEKLFFKVVKTAFNQRRKKLSNSLKSFQLTDKLKEDTIFAKRPEQLTVNDFILLTQKIEHHVGSD